MIIATALVLSLQASAPSEVDLSSVKGADLELLQTVRVVAKNVERLRAQPFARLPVAVRVPADLCDVAATIRFRNALPAARLAARGRAWASLGLGTVDSPAAVVRTLSTDLPGICFDPDGNRLLVLSGMFPTPEWAEGEDVDRSELGFATGVDPDEPLLAHLLTHVGTHERDGALDASTTDEFLARGAWSEGEANLVAMRYLFSGLGLADEVLESSLGPDEVLSGALVPSSMDQLDDVAQRLVRFVYVEGLVRAAEVHAKDGAPGLDRASRSRRTTRQVLHAAASGEIAALAEPLPPAAGLRLADTDSLGEHATAVLISLLTGKDNLGLQVGDGWAGDRLYRWERDTGAADAVTEWVTRWASEQAAQDFVYAYHRGLLERLPAAESNEPTAGTRLVTAGGRRFRIERTGSEVRVRVQSIAPPPPGH